MVPLIRPKQIERPFRLTPGTKVEITGFHATELPENRGLIGKRGTIVEGVPMFARVEKRKDRRTFVECSLHMEGEPGPRRFRAIRFKGVSVSLATCYNYQKLIDQGRMCPKCYQNWITKGPCDCVKK